METEEDREYQETQNTLLQEVSLSFPHVENTGNPSVSIPIPMSVPVPNPILSAANTSILPESEDQRMKDRLDNLREPVSERGPVIGKLPAPFEFSTPVTVTLPHRITSIPISPIMTPSEVAKSFREQDAQQEKEILELAEKMNKERKMGIE